MSAPALSTGSSTSAIRHWSMSWSSSVPCRAGACAIASARASGSPSSRAFARPVSDSRIRSAAADESNSFSTASGTSLVNSSSRSKLSLSGSWSAWSSARSGASSSSRSGSASSSVMLPSSSCSMRSSSSASGSWRISIDWMTRGASFIDWPSFIDCDWLKCIDTLTAPPPAPGPRWHRRARPCWPAASTTPRAAREQAG
jgi:hypothetical protein